MTFFRADKFNCDFNHTMADYHCHDYYEIYFLLNGTRDSFIENNFYIISEKTVTIIPPFVLHKTAGGPYKRINLDIGTDYLSNNALTLLEELEIIRTFSFDGSRLANILSTLNDIYSFYKEDAKNNYDIIRILVEKVIADLYLSATNKNAKTNYYKKNVPPIITEIINYLNNSFQYNFSAKMVAENFQISHGHLARIFKHYTNLSISDFVLKLKLSKAKQLLAKTDKNMSEIANLCGFVSANYFSLIFKKNVGISPLFFRKYERETHF